MLQIIKKPLITEKSTVQTEELNQFVFKVDTKASKYQIKEAIENQYDVKVVKIRTAIFSGKVKRRGTNVGRKANWKKAVVSLAEGQTIDFYAEA